MVEWQDCRVVVMLILFISMTACAVIPEIPDSTTPRENTALGFYISDPVLSGSQLYFGAGYCLYRLNIDDRSLEDILCMPGWTFNKIAVDARRVYAQMYDFLGRNQSFGAVDLQTGEMLWQTEVRDRTSWNLHVGETVRFDDVVITVQPDDKSNRDRIAAFGAATGELIWTSRSTYIRKLDPLTVQEGLLWYVGSNREGIGSLVALDPDTGRRVNRVRFREFDCDRLRLREFDFDQILLVNDTQIIGFDETPDRVISVDRKRKEANWEVSLETITSIYPVVQYDRTLALYGGGSEIYGLDMQTGEVLWITTDHSPLAEDALMGKIHPFVITDWRGDTIYGVDIVTGQIIWRHPMDCNIHRTGVVVDGEFIYVLTSDSVLALLTVDGTQLWEREVDTTVEYWVDYLDREESE